MSWAAIFTWLSYRSAFILLAIFLFASLVVVLIAMLLNPSPYPAWGFAAVALLLVLTSVFTGWVLTHPEREDAVPRD